MIIVLNNIRSGWNVGSVMRSCDGLGAKLILVGYTPRPVENNLKLINKTAIGAEKTVKWEHFEHYQEVFEKYPINDFNHLGIEISDTSHNIFDYLKNINLKTKENIIWFGNEIHGLDKDLLELLQTEVHLPMKGLKESLNVANTVCTVGYLMLEHEAI
jgi:23S rRNA (guanosine2251-2'-O)-methyltransferase